VTWRTHEVIQKHPNLDVQDVNIGLVVLARQLKHSYLLVGTMLCTSVTQVLLCPICPDEAWLWARRDTCTGMVTSSSGIGDFVAGAHRSQACHMCCAPPRW
jgi:hypothetical protein